MKTRGGVVHRCRWRRSIKDRLSLLVQCNHLSQSFCDSFNSLCCLETLTENTTHRGRPRCIKLVEFKEPRAKTVWPLVFIALDYHVVNMHLEWILTVRTQQGKVKVSDNGCTGYWGGRRELLAVLDHFYIGIFLWTAGLQCILKRITVPNGHKIANGATKHYFIIKVWNCNRLICLSFG